MIIFVGDEPSTKNVDPNIPFVGTQSYKKLLEWIWEMDLDINNILVCNRKDLDYDYVSGRVYINFTYITHKLNQEDCKIIALGNKVDEQLDEYSSLKYLKIPHPSPRNRKLNDKKYIKKVLKECKEWING